MERDAIPGEVIQIAPPHRWVYSFWTVETVHPWGVVAYSPIPGQNGVSYVRLEHGKYAIIGRAAWILRTDDIFEAPTPDDTQEAAAVRKPPC